MTTPTQKPERPKTRVHATLADEIGRRIVRGDFAPGAVLPNEAQWSMEFGASRSAVREAIKILMAKGLLSSKPRVGSRVEPRERWNLLDRDVLGWYAEAPDKSGFLRSVQEFRYVIEPEAAAFAALRRSEAQLAQISQACANMGDAATLAERTAADTRFHMAILRAAGNELLAPLGVLIEAAFVQLFAFTSREDHDYARAQALHEDIVAAIAARDADLARQTVRKLLGNTDKVIGAG